MSFQGYFSYHHYSAHIGKYCLLLTATVSPIFLSLLIHHYRLLNTAYLETTQIFLSHIRGGRSCLGWVTVMRGVLLASDPWGVFHRWETIGMNLQRQTATHITARLLSIYICSLLHSKPENIMSTNNSEENEINEGYNCVWNCNYCYCSLLFLWQGFSVSRCANGKACHCFSGLDQVYSLPPALLTCNY